MSTKIPLPATEGFANASLYDTHRPSYPQEAVDTLLAKLQVKDINDARIIDAGAGTGKFSELVANRKEGYQIVAIEPHEDMRRVCEAKGLTGVKVVDGVANRIPVETQWADAVVVAQYGDRVPFPLALTKKRFATDEALQEIYRVLTPGGHLGMIWNVEDYNAPRSWEPRTAWEGTMKDIVWSLDDQHPRFRHQMWRQVFENQSSSNPFAIQAADPLFSLPLGEDSIEFVYWLSPEAIWDRFGSLSQIAVLKDEEVASVKDKIFEAMNAPDVEKNDAGDLPLHGHVVLAWTRSVPGAPLG